MTTPMDFSPTAAALSAAATEGQVVARREVCEYGLLPVQSFFPRLDGPAAVLALVRKLHAVARPLGEAGGSRECPHPRPAPNRPSPVRPGPVSFALGGRDRYSRQALLLQHSEAEQDRKGLCRAFGSGGLYTAQVRSQGEGVAFKLKWCLWSGKPRPS